MTTKRQLAFLQAEREEVNKATGIKRKEWAVEKFKKLFKKVLSAKSYKYCMGNIWNYSVATQIDIWAWELSKADKLYKTEMDFINKSVFSNKKIQGFIKVAIIKNFRNRIQALKVAEDLFVSKKKIFNQGEESTEKIGENSTLQEEDFAGTLARITALMLEILELKKEHSSFSNVEAKIPDNVLEHILGNQFFDEELQLLLLAFAKESSKRKLKMKYHNSVPEHAKTLEYSELIIDYLLVAEHLKIPEKMMDADKRDRPMISKKITSLIAKLRQKPITDEKIKSQLLRIFDHSFLNG